MKQRNLLLSFCLVSGSAIFAANSPYAGAPAAEGSYFLYQVESGTWLQTNRNPNGADDWTTHAELGGIGFDVELKKLDGFNEGFQIFCKFSNNGELNGSDRDRFFLDQGDRMLTEWIFEPIEGTNNQYKIKVKAREVAEDRQERDGVAEDHYIGHNAEAGYGGLSDDPTDLTWQLVTREERIQKMVEEAKAGKPADATFLLPWNDHGRNDLRDREWKVVDENLHGGGLGLNGTRHYPVFERWHRVNHSASIDLKDLPNGTYSFAVQGYYRDGDIDDEGVRARALAGESVKRAKYFAGAESAYVKSIFDDAKAEAQAGFPYEVALVNEDEIVEKTLFVPNSMDDAGDAFWVENNDVMSMDTPYMNDWISAGVSDGTLTIGVSKEGNDDACHHDWFIYKRMFLRYDSEAIKGEDLSALQADLSKLIEEAKALPSTPKFAEAITAAEDALANAKSSSALINATSDLQEWVIMINLAKGDINAFNETLQYVAAADQVEAQQKFDEADNRDAFGDAIKTLRYARRRAAAERQEDVFVGAKPEIDGKYYLYNVGQKQFLSGGSDWGAHAALSMPGVEITLLDLNDNGEDFTIETGLYNGPDNHYLSYGGYMDGTFAGGEWKFVPVEGKENVFNIFQGDYPDVHVAWNPWAKVDANNSDETTVGTECRDLDPADENAQWKLVTRAEREALLEKASVENPVDATIFIASPNFNQREDAEAIWNLGNSNVWEYGSNHYDFAAESYNTDDCDINQIVENLPAGLYKVSVQGFYRNGHHNLQANNELLQNAVLYANFEEAPLMNINEEAGKAPGEGNDSFNEDRTVCHHIPDGIVQATNFFKSGLYKTSLLIEKEDDSELSIGVYKDEKGADDDWVVVDNFRLTYYGPDAKKSDLDGSAVEEIEAAASINDNRIYNLQGIEVKNANVPGIYICNGKKFVVK